MNLLWNPPLNSRDDRRPLVLHACCAPCATHCIEVLREEAWEPTVLFLNDNIGDPDEYARRLDALRQLCEALCVDLRVPAPDHAAWLRGISGWEGEPEGGKRCAACFRHNLGATARWAAQHGFAHFTTTWSVSPHKSTTALFEAGKAASEIPSETTGTTPNSQAFVPYDFKKRGGFQRSVELSRRFGLYRQTYCGCEFSRTLTTRE